MNILDRIKYIVEKEGVSIHSLEVKIGASRGVLSKAMKMKTDIQSKWVQSIATLYPQYSSKWLLTGQGDIYCDNYHNNNHSTGDRNELSNVEKIDIEFEITNNIISNIKQIRYLYQRIVDIQILLKDKLRVYEEVDYIELASETLNNFTRQYVEQWKDFDLEKKKAYNQKLIDAVRLLQDMFFDRFRLLYNNMRKNDFDI